MSFWTSIIITGSGGGSITISSPSSGTVDGTNTQFGFSSKPNVIVSDDAIYRENYGFTWNSGTLTATLAVAPVYDVFAIM